LSKLALSMTFFVEVYYWGCAKVSGRGTLYMKWGQQNQRFGTMRLRGEKKRNKEEREKEIIKCDKY